MPTGHDDARAEPRKPRTTSNPEAGRGTARASAAKALGSAGIPAAIGGPTTSSWREDALARIAELDMLTIMARAGTTQPSHVADEIQATIRVHLHTAKVAAERPSDRRAGAAGADVTRVMTNIHVAEADLLRLAPLEYVAGQLTTLHAYVREHVPARDPRRARLESIIRSLGRAELTESHRGAIIAAAREANAEARREVTRVRSFRNVLLVTAAILTLAAIGIGTLGVLDPEALPMCFNPGDQVVCATEVGPGVAAGGDLDEAVGATVSRWDLPLVELVGLIAAAVAAAVALRGIRGTTTPYGLPVALALLKLPTGALTAVLGLLLMRGQFVPGLSALDSSAQIIAWAVVFGYAQQLFTRVVDAQAQSVLSDVGGKSPGPVPHEPAAVI